MENIFALAFFILTAVRYGYSFSVQLEKLSTLYLPYDYTRPTPRYGLFGDAAQQLAYDTEGRLLYTAGKTFYLFAHSLVYFLAHLSR